MFACDTLPEEAGGDHPVNLKFAPGPALLEFPPFGFRRRDVAPELSIDNLRPNPRIAVARRLIAVRYLSEAICPRRGGVSAIYSLVRSEPSCFWFAHASMWHAIARHLLTIEFAISV